MRLGLYVHFLRHALRLKRDPAYRVPLSMHVHVTNRCPHHCLYCDYDRTEPDRLSLDVLRGIFREAGDLGTRRINLTGGEPLLRDDLADVVGLAKEQGFFVSMATSGYRAAERLPALRQCDRVMLSFDGPFEVREKLCGHLFAEASEAAVELFKANRIPFWTTTVLTRHAIPHIDWIVDHARRHGCQANFAPLQTQADGGLRVHPSPGDVTDLQPTDEQQRGAFRHLVELKRGGAPIGSSLPYLEEILRWPDLGRLRSREASPFYKECIALRSTCELRSDGRLDACDLAFGEMSGVSVLEAGFAEAFRKLPFTSDCRSCISVCMLESNLIFTLNPRTVWNWVKRLR